MAATVQELHSHPFGGYNKPLSAFDDAPTLVGNWQEERALRDMTGVSRYENAHDWQSMVKVSYQDPKSRKKLQDYHNLSKLGPRAKQEMEAMMAEAGSLPDEVLYTLQGRPMPPVLDSTYQAHFDEKDMTGCSVGAKVMRDHDGRPAVRDPTFLAEMQMIDKSTADRLIPNAAACGATQTILLPDPDAPITIYTETVASNKYGSTVYGTRTMSHVTPFAKYTNFSKPMSEYSKVAIDE